MKNSRHKVVAMKPPRLSSLKSYSMSNQALAKWSQELLWMTSEITLATFRRVSQLRHRTKDREFSLMLIDSATHLKRPKAVVLTCGRVKSPSVVRIPWLWAPSTRNWTSTPKITMSSKNKPWLPFSREHGIEILMTRRKNSPRARGNKPRWAIWCVQESQLRAFSNKCTCRASMSKLLNNSRSLRKKTREWHLLLQPWSTPRTEFQLKNKSKKLLRFGLVRMQRDLSKSTITTVNSTKV